MRSQLVRLAAGVVALLVTGGVGYAFGDSGAPPAGGPANVAAPAANSVRVIYSLDQKENDKEIIALIDGAKSHIYFAMYEFTLQDIADALIAAKRRGVDVEGLVDAGESANSYDAPVVGSLRAAGIAVATEHHADGNGIMHIKAIATEGAYALGSYNWTGSATSENDELLEIGTDPALVATYNSILKRIIAQYAGASGPTGSGGEMGAQSITGTYAYTDAAKHIGEYAAIRGTLVDAYTAASGTIFLDFCKSYKSCAFSAVIFADNAKSFGDLSRYAGHQVTITGNIASYQNQAEIVLNDPSQIAD